MKQSTLAPFGGESRLMAPSSRLSDIAPISRFGPEALIDLDDKTVQKFKKLQYKMEKIKTQFESSYGGLSSSMKESLNDINSVCQGYRNMIAEQSRTMIKLANDFQQQIAQLTRSFHAQIADVEQSYRMAMGAVPLQAPVPIQPAIQYRPSYPRAALESESLYSDDESSESDTQRNVRLWRRNRRD